MRRKFKLQVLGGIAFLFCVGLVFPLFFHSSTASSQQVMTKFYDQKRFFQQIAPQAKRLSASYGVKASVIMAQAAFESDYGNNLLASKYKNLMAVKAKAGEQSVTLNRKEFVGSNELTIKNKFRVYPDWTSSLNDYMILLSTDQLGKKGLYQALATADDYKTAVAVFKDYKFTSDSSYAKQLINVIEMYKLTTYD